MACGVLIFTESVFLAVVANKKMGLNNKKISDRKYCNLFISFVLISQKSINILSAWL